MDGPKVLVMGGSLRRGSFNQRAAEIAAAGARAAGATTTVVRLADLPLPLFNEDDEKASGPPEAARRLKAALKAHDALLIASPEYNGGYTAALKNAIDWASRSEPGEPALAAFTGKVAGLVAASPGGLGGLRGLVQLRMLLAGLGVLVVPEQYALAKAHEAFGADGALKDEKARAALEGVGRRTAEVAARLRAEAAP